MIYRLNKKLLKKRNYGFFFLLMFVLTSGMSQPLPSSSLSKEVIKKLSPDLSLELQKAHLKLGAAVFIRIFKQEGVLELWLKGSDNFKLFKQYKICTYGFAGLGPKISQGDGKAPEGFYFVKANQLNPYSSYHLSFNLGYPNAYDRSHRRTGSALMVHGNCVSVGCYAMTDSKIEEIYTIVYAALANGQAFFRVHAFPFEMTDENMSKHKDSKWYEFWKNLKQGYDYFTAHNNNPPNVEVKNSIYIFD